MSRRFIGWQQVIVGGLLLILSFCPPPRDADLLMRFCGALFLVLGYLDIRNAP